MPKGIIEAQYCEKCGKILESRLMCYCGFPTKKIKLIRVDDVKEKVEGI